MLSLSLSSANVIIKNVVCLGLTFKGQNEQFSEISTDKRLKGTQKWPKEKIYVI